MFFRRRRRRRLRRVNPPLKKEKEGKTTITPFNYRSERVFPSRCKILKHCLRSKACENFTDESVSGFFGLASLALLVLEQKLI